MDTTAKDIMSSPCITIKENADVEDFFFQKSGEKKLISMPVVDEKGNLAGIITLSDIIHLIGINAAAK